PAARAALQGLDGLLGWHIGRHQSVFALRALALKALVLQSLEQTPEALAVLQRAVAMAAPGRFVRSFVDLGPPMRDLLGRLSAESSTSLYIGHLLSRFPRTVDTHANVSQERPRSELTES